MDIAQYIFAYPFSLENVKEEDFNDDHIRLRSL